MYILEMLLAVSHLLRLITYIDKLPLCCPILAPLAENASS